MLTRERLGSIKRILLGGLMGAGLLVWTGCGGVSPSNVSDLISQLGGDLDIGAAATGLTIRIVNQSADLTEELDVRVDGVLRTFTCEPEVGVCDSVLAELPSLLEVVAERRLDEEGGFRGGRNLEGQPGFTFTPSDLQPGAIIVFQFSEEEASARVLPS